MWDIILNAKNYFYLEKILIRRVRQSQLHELQSIWVPEQINDLYPTEKY